MKKYLFVISLIGQVLIISVLLLVSLHVSILFIKKIKKDNLYHALLNDFQKKSYNYLDIKEIEELLTYTWYRKWKYSNLTGFFEGPAKSNFVNVNNFGVRSNSKNNFISYTDLNDSVWFFGGSTTFGYGVEDYNTIPAKLEKLLNNKVINFGTGFFDSSLENILFNNYVFTHRPKIAIFLDGINEGCKVDAYQTEFKNLFEQAQIRYRWRLNDIFAPLFFYTNKITKKNIIDDNPWKDKEKSCSKNGKKIGLDLIVDKNLKERKQICKNYNVNCITFLQPFPRIHVSHLDKSRLSDESTKSLRLLYKTIKNVFIENDSIELGKSFENLNEHFFVDTVHYSKDANEIIAKSIFKILNDKQLINK